MKRTFFIALSASLLTATTEGQDFFKQLGQELQRQGRQTLQNRGVPPQYVGSPQRGGGGQQGTYNSRSLPSEGGNNSGGNRDNFRGGNDFMLPGGGGGGFQRQDPGLHYRTQPYQNGRPLQGNQPYISGQPYQGSQPYQVVQPGYTTPGVVSGADIPTAPVDSSQYVVIRCPQSANGSCRYTLESNRGNYAFTMSPGKEQRFRASTQWIISYHDGTQQRRYRLNGGKSYTLKKDGTRWQLYSVAHPGS